MTSVNLLNRYGKKGILKIPQAGGTFDPRTGKTIAIDDEYGVTYLLYTDSSNPNFSSSYAQESIINFMLTDQNTTALEVQSNAFIDDMDIYKISKLQIRGETVLFQGFMKSLT